MNIEVAQHQLKAADAEIARARDAVSYTTITSPIDGVVTRINAKVGELVVTGTMNNPGTMIMEVADLSQMLLVVQLDEADVGKVKAGRRDDRGRQSAGKRTGYIETSKRRAKQVWGRPRRAGNRRLDGQRFPRSRSG